MFPVWQNWETLQNMHLYECFWNDMLPRFVDVLLKLTRVRILRKR